MVARLPHCSAEEVQDRLAAADESSGANKDLSEYPLGERNVFRVLANNPALLRAFVRWVNALWQQSGLDDRETELVVLAVAAATGSRYEWHRHIQLAREAGVHDAEIAAVAEGEFERFADRERRLLRFVAAALDRSVTDGQVADAGTHFSDAALVGVALLVGTYAGLGIVIDALGVEPERPFVGWRPD